MQTQLAAKRCLSLILTIVFVTIGEHAFATPLYRLIALGTLGGTDSSAYGINNSGQVVGFSYTSGAPASSGRAFRTKPNAVINPATDNLGTLGGHISIAFGINESGQVVGGSSLSNGQSHAFRTQPNSVINPATDDLGTLGGTQSQAQAINNLGEVVGHSFVPGDGFQRAFRTGPNAAINPATDNLGSLGGNESGAWNINDNGQVVGYSFRPGNSIIHAFRTEARSAIDAATDDIGAAISSHSDARGINNLGQVVGSAYFSGISLYNPYRIEPNAKINALTDNLGRPAGTTAATLWAINQYGWAVGADSTASEPSHHALLFDGSALMDLNDIVDSSADGWILQFATDINDHGQIVGFGTFQGSRRAFRLDLVPEPTSLLLLTFAACSVVSVRRR